MSIQFVKSKDIKAFPAGFRGPGFGQSKLTSEENLINLITNSSGDQSNTLFKQDERQKDNSIVGFVIIRIAGYYFKILQDAIPKTSSTLYAYIQLRDLEGQVGKVLAPYDGISVLDDNGEFKGLCFSSENPSQVDSKYKIQICDEKGDLIIREMSVKTSQVFNENSTTVDHELDSNIIKTNQLGVLSDSLLKIPAEIQLSNNKKLKIDSDFQINQGAKMILEGSGESENKIISSSGTLNLPANPLENKQALVFDNNTSSWLAYSSASTANTLVLRDEKGGIKAASINGFNLSAANSNSSIVVRDASGNSSFNNISLTGSEFSGKSGVLNLIAGNSKIQLSDLTNTISVKNLDNEKFGIITQLKQTATGKINSITTSNKCYMLSDDLYSNNAQVLTTNSKIKISNLINDDSSPAASIVLGTTACALGSTTKKIEGFDSISSKQFIATSDKRLKENIKLFSPKASILDLPVVTFDFIDGPKNQIGCIAQDLQKLYPELIVENADGYLAVNDSKLVYLLLHEVKVLSKKVADLEDKLQTKETINEE